MKWTALVTTFVTALLLAPAALAQHAHPHEHAADRAIVFPDVEGFQTLVCDFHMHTVFSDGDVWPTIRVEEALRDGLDCIAVTDHLEYQPHSDDLPHPDRNRSFDLAARHAARHDLIVLRGSEITRSMPPGHANAIFIEDANRLLVEDAEEAFREAARQGGFTFWNHPDWTAQRPDGLATLTDMHRRLIDEGLLDGIEVVNDLTYSDEALQIALDHDLALIGTSDIHGLVDWQYEVPQGGHRPVTLVFATERSADGLRAALDARRTAVYYNDVLIGRERELLPLLEAAVVVTGAAYQDDTHVLEVELTNTSDLPLLLRNRSPYTFRNAADVVRLAPHATTHLHVKPGERVEAVELPFEVLNAVTAPSTHPTLVLRAEAAR